MHSLVLIDDALLVDAPPTVVPQMRKHGICPSQITDLFITLARRPYFWSSIHVARKKMDF